MKKLFIAFPSFEVQLQQKIEKLDNIEFWNLSLIEKNEFLENIARKIKPYNENIKRKYKELLNDSTFENVYAKSSFGILLPDLSDDNISTIYEANTIIKLFSGLYIPIMFNVNVLGPEIVNKEIPIYIEAQFHKIDLIFNNKKFVNYFKKLINVLLLLDFSSTKIINWNKENWRLYNTILLFNELEHYQYKKNSIIWPKECAEIVTIYENLLSQERNDNGKYRIIQRIEILLSDYYSNEIETIKKELSHLFNYRNEYIHGSFYLYLNKNTQNQSNRNIEMPTVEFNFLQDQNLYLRRVISIYLYLVANFGIENNIAQKIHNAIMDLNERKLINKFSKEILKLMD